VGKSGHFCKQELDEERTHIWTKWQRGISSGCCAFKTAFDVDVVKLRNPCFYAAVTMHLTHRSLLGEICLRSTGWPRK